MFDLGWPELLLIMVVALIVIGPKELPNAIRTVSMVVRKIRGAAREFQSGLDDIARETGVDEVKRDFDNMTRYDPNTALSDFAETDKDILGLEDDPMASGNNILDPERKPAASDSITGPGGEFDDMRPATRDEAPATTESEPAKPASPGEKTA